MDNMFEDRLKRSTTPSQSVDSCQVSNRKRRRGVIEKRRRDRINTSLTELRRLVPAAFEKSGSAKLEKAEILQMTVDHLRVLHSKGIDALHPYGDINKIAMDYHTLGFRECAAEVARYLVACEGLEIQDPLRLRLMSHMQCFATQREIAAKSQNWNATLQFPSSNQYVQSNSISATTTPAGPGGILPGQQQDLNSVGMSSVVLSGLSEPTAFTPIQSFNTGINGLPEPGPSYNRVSSSANGVSAFSTFTNTSAPSTVASLNPITSVGIPGGVAQPTPTRMISPSNQSGYAPNSMANMRTYRPWGAEFAY